MTITSINGVPTATFSAFSNKLEATRTSFELLSNFTLGNTSDGINPLTEVTVLQVGSFVVTIPASLFRKRAKTTIRTTAKAVTFTKARSTVKDWKFRLCRRRAINIR